MEQPERPEPRSTEEIFEDLRTLAQSDGALHELSGLIYRDWVITVDMKEARVADTPDERWSTSKLNKNELLLLLGLLVQSPSDRTFSVHSAGEGFAARADMLLSEFHDRVMKDGAPIFDKTAMKFSDLPNAIGGLGREAIYYGAESFYLHQFARFTRMRYRDDADWLLPSAGFSVRPMVEMAEFIVDRVNRQITGTGHLRTEGAEFSNGDLTNSLLMAKADLTSKFGKKAEAFLARFATRATASNEGFEGPFSVNMVSIAPIIDLGKHLYLPSQYRLLEAIYEGPFYWMLADKAYSDTAADHRGKFVERTAAHILKSVFGDENVHENVFFWQSKDIGAEADVLVVYGEFILVVQAKSKRITQKARAGDAEALKIDFKGAIQDPYGQALSCTKHVLGGAKCTNAAGEELKLPTLPRVFPMVVLSDPFPAATFLSGMLLERGKDIAPVVWDLGVLDCVARLLPTPIELIFYLKCRSDVFETVHSDSEYNFLGYHIRAKLGVPDGYDWMMLERDFATVVDDYMISADVGRQADRPKGILERLEIPVMSDLLSALKQAEPRIAAVVIDLYDFSSAALEDLSKTILDLRKEIRDTGKAIKAFSLQTASGGLTYAVVKTRGTRSQAAARAIGAKHKYDTRSDRWYVIVDSIETELPIDGILPMVWPWTDNEEDAALSAQVAGMFNSTPVERTVDKRRGDEEDKASE